MLTRALGIASRFARNPRPYVWVAATKLPELRLTRTTPHGRITFSSRDHVIGRLLFTQGHFHAEQQEQVMRILAAERPQDAGALLDVGANIGTTTCGLARRFERTLAFEPEPRNFELLQRNVRQNGLAGRVTALPVALSDHDGVADMGISDVNSGDHRIGVHGRARSVSVPLRRLDDVIESQGVAPEAVRLWWQDTQGHELHVLRGAPRLLAARAPLLVEFWPAALQAQGADPAEMLALLASHYRRFYDLLDPRPRPVSELGTLLDRYVGSHAETDLFLF